MAQYASLRDEKGFVLPDPFNLLVHLREDQSGRKGPGVDKCVVHDCPSRRLYSTLNLRMPYCPEHLDTIRFNIGWLLGTLQHYEPDEGTRDLTLFVYDSVRRAQAFLAGEDYSWELFNRAAATPTQN